MFFQRIGANKGYCVCRIGEAGDEDDDVATYIINDVLFDMIRETDQEPGIELVELADEGRGRRRSGDRGMRGGTAARVVDVRRGRGGYMVVG